MDRAFAMVFHWTFVVVIAVVTVVCQRIPVILWAFEAFWAYSWHLLSTLLNLAMYFLSSLCLNLLNCIEENSIGLGLAS